MVTDDKIKGWNEMKEEEDKDKVVEEEEQDYFYINVI